MANSKNKGNKFERVCSQFWANWTGYKFSRTPGSGGWAKSKDSFGDVTCTDDKHSRRFPFSVECKSYEDIRFEHVLLGNKSCKILDFWEQARSDAMTSNKIPVLMMKYNGMTKGESFFVISKDMFDAWVNFRGESKVHFRKPIMAMQVNPNLIFYVLMTSDVKQQDYKTFYKAARKLIKQESSQSPF